MKYTIIILSLLLASCKITKDYTYLESIFDNEVLVFIEKSDVKTYVIGQRAYNRLQKQNYHKNRCLVYVEIQGTWEIMCSVFEGDLLTEKEVKQIVLTDDLIPYYE